jgi:RNA-directed DNA polymerase
MKPPNKDRKRSAEVAQESAPAKENSGELYRFPTQSRRGVSQGLAGVRQAARERKAEKFTALLHHLTAGLLKESYDALKRQAAPGVDGMRWSDYEDGKEERLEELDDRIHRGAYQAQPSRRAYIAKADGRQRPLGIVALEDKIVQQAVVTILNQILQGLYYAGKWVSRRVSDD